MTPGLFHYNFRALNDTGRDIRQFGSAAIELGAVLMTTEEIINPVIDRMWYMASRAIFSTRAACLTDRLKSIANIRTQSAVVKTQLRRKNRLMRAGHVEEAERIRAPGMGATTGESGGRDPQHL